MTEKEKFAKLSSIAKCPLCGRDLGRGYVSPEGGLHWDTKEHRWVMGAEHLAFDTFLTKNMPALRCVRCKIAILDYERWCR